MSSKLPVAVCALVLLSCLGRPVVVESPRRAGVMEHTVGAVLWLQCSAEARALRYQTFQLARLRLDEALRRPADRRRAVVVDIDETVLDNAPFEASLIVADREYPHGWGGWVAAAQAEAVPGAVGFLRHAVERGVDVFYLSNRREDQLDATLRNLRACGLPQAIPSHVLLRTQAAGKGERRREVSSTHEVILLLGDSLQDFSEGFLGLSSPERRAEVDRQREEWGMRFLILPNPVYGDWETVHYGGDVHLPPAEKDRRRKAALRPWPGPEASAAPP